VSQYEPGHRLRFVRQTKHFDRGDTLEVVAAVENGLRFAAGRREVDFVLAVRSFDVGEAPRVESVVR